MGQQWFWFYVYAPCYFKLRATFIWHKLELGALEQTAWRRKGPLNSTHNGAALEPEATAQRVFNIYLLAPQLTATFQPPRHRVFAVQSVGPSVLERTSLFGGSTLPRSRDAVLSSYTSSSQRASWTPDSSEIC
ncbi:hypothetical protein Tcan_09905 [Toxocara canis]|uniref:Uncharacterized protein n=1 Tax=Toxocara canis TaxID=6265 RepID=A0A0B2VGP1_TOXCA|nr:hypothetical protein Tcan_09905 [Toxocara canis]